MLQIEHIYGMDRDKCHTYRVFYDDLTSFGLLVLQYIDISISLFSILSKSSNFQNKCLMTQAFSDFIIKPVAIHPISVQNLYDQLETTCISMSFVYFTLDQLGSGSVMFFSNTWKMILHCCLIFQHIQGVQQRLQHLWFN